MALLWFDGFDELPDSGQGTYLTSAGYLFALGVSHTVGRGNKGRCVDLTGNTSQLQRYVGSTSEIFTGFGFKYDGSLVVDNVVSFARDTGQAIEVGLKVQRTLSNGLQLTNEDGSVIHGQTVGNIIQQNVWAYLEHHIVFNGVASKWVCRVNNQQVADITFDGTGLTMDRVAFDKQASGSHFIDDLYILDTSGTTNIDFLGDVFVENIPLASDASPIQFTPVGSVVNFSAINETGPSDDNKYTVSSAVGARDMFNVAGLNILVDQVFAVMVGIRHRKIGSGAVTVRAVLNDGTVDTLGAEFAPDTDFRTDFLSFSETPSGSPWTINDFNNITVGYEIAS
jgi:hypothetical protein